MRCTTENDNDVMSATMSRKARATRAACVSDVSVKLDFGTNGLKKFI